MTQPPAANTIHSEGVGALPRSKTVFMVTATVPAQVNPIDPPLQGTKAGFQSALWICAAIGAAKLVTSFILKPRPLVTADSPAQLAH
jgi:hypothetical protein